jgi:hypothetical protein
VRWSWAESIFTTPSRKMNPWVCALAGGPPELTKWLLGLAHSQQIVNSNLTPATNSMRSALSR